MAVTASNLTQGPGTLFTGAFGATEPAAVGTAPGAGWTDVGGTDGGVKISVKHEYAELEVDQLLDTPERRLTKRETSVETSLAEPTMANVLLALNSYGTANTAAGASTLTPGNGVTATTGPTYSALLFDGVAPGGFKRRVIVRKALSTEGVESEWKKEDKTMIPVTFMAHWVSTSITPWTWVDATA